jgi:hypothetical protein
MTPMKWKSTEKRMKSLQDMDTLRSERHMSREDLKRINLSIRVEKDSNAQVLHGVIKSKDGGEAYSISLKFRPLSGGAEFGQAISLLIDNKSIDPLVATNYGNDLLNHWGPIVQTMMSSYAERKVADQFVVQEQQDFEKSEAEKKREAKRDEERKLLGNLF